MNADYIELLAFLGKFSIGLRLLLETFCVMLILNLVILTNFGCFLKTNFSENSQTSILLKKEKNLTQFNLGKYTNQRKIIFTLLIFTHIV